MQKQTSFSKQKPNTSLKRLPSGKSSSTVKSKQTFSDNKSVNFSEKEESKGSKNLKKGFGTDSMGDY